MDGPYDAPSYCAVEAEEGAREEDQDAPRWYSAVRRRSSMQYVNLGGGGTKVSRICLGTMNFGARRWRS